MPSLGGTIPEGATVVDITDRDEHMERVDQSTLLHDTRKARHMSLENLHLLFRPRSVSEHWCRVEAAHNIKVGDAVLMRFGYVQVREILSNSTSHSDIVLRGVRLRQASDAFPGLDCLNNEVMLVQDLYKDSTRYDHAHFLENFTYEDVQQPLSIKKVAFTNISRSHWGQRPSSEPWPHLVCRLKYVSVFNCPSTRKKKPEQQICAYLAESEADAGAGFRISERRLRQEDSIGRDVGHSGPVALDACCGAGFATVAAKAAGMVVTKAFDHNYQALQTYTYRTNHPEVCALHMEFSDFVHLCGTWLRPEILLLSPPCQYFSNAHTRAGRNDDANEATSFGIADLVGKLKPRVVIIENTFGLNGPRFAQHLNSFITGLLNLDYSVRKAVINLGGLGEASTRRRLVIIAAKQGESLPDFPRQEFNTSFGPATDADLLPTVSVFDRLQLVIENHPDHRPHLEDFTVPRASWDPRSAKMCTITCGKGSSPKSHHWSGKRNWTPHELCVLQGAPPTFRFHPSLSKSTKSHQAGNAFVCLAAEGVYRKVVESLRKTDEADARMNAEEAAGKPGSSTERPICL